MTDVLPDLLALPGVADAGDRARSRVDELLRHRVLRRRTADVSAEVGLRCARASALLEDEDRSLEALRVALASATGAGVAGAALRANAELAGVAETLGRAPLQAFARLHVLAARDSAPEDQLGRPRVGSEQPTDLTWLPPAVPADYAGPRLAQLGSLLTTASRQTPALVLAAVVHGELLAIRPFAQRSGVVARVAARAVLVWRGLDPKALVAVDVGHAQDPQAYRDAAAAYVTGDVASWLRHCAGAVEHGALEGLAICEALQR